MKLKSTIGRIMSVTLASVMLFNVTPWPLQLRQKQNRRSSMR